MRDAGCFARNNGEETCTPWRGFEVHRSELAELHKYHQSDICKERSVTEIGRKGNYPWLRNKGTSKFKSL